MWSGESLVRGLQDECKFDLGATFSYTFPDPSVAINDDGTIEVCFWVKSGGGMRPEWRYYEKFLRFNENGEIADEGLRRQLVKGLKVVRIGKYGSPVNSDTND